jgi:hypothetical protein
LAGEIPQPGVAESHGYGLVQIPENDALSWNAAKTLNPAFFTGDTDTVEMVEDSI